MSDRLHLRFGGIILFVGVAAATLTSIYFFAGGYRRARFTSLLADPIQLVTVHPSLLALAAAETAVLCYGVFLVAKGVRNSRR